MNEIMNTHRVNGELRWQLLVSASAAALLVAAYGSTEAEAADSDRPTVWIELGGQLDFLAGSQENFAPPFMPAFAQANMGNTVDVQGSPRYSLGTEGKIILQPSGGDWQFSASVQYGRAKRSQYRHQQSVNPYIGPIHFSVNYIGYLNGGLKYPHKHVRFAEATAQQSKSRLVLDFQAGKDVGLGLFGNSGSSVLSGGVRFAQFTSKGSVNLEGVPDLQYHVPTNPITSLTAFRSQFKYVPVNFHNYKGMLDYDRSFSGVGPSLAWNSSLPFAGGSDSGQLSLDLGANAAVLFGRQKASGHHQTTARSYHGSKWYIQRARDGRGIAHRTGDFIASGWFVTSKGTPHYNSGDFNRAHTVVVPNVGGSIGFSYRIEDFKVALGYRADFFFGAMDGGIDTRKSEELGLHGPFATISVGLGG